jgi:hypothetical protein
MFHMSSTRCLTLTQGLPVTYRDRFVSLPCHVGPSLTLSVYGQVGLKDAVIPGVNLELRYSTTVGAVLSS